MNNSIGIWFDSKDKDKDNIKSTLELHINLWKLKTLRKSSKESPYFLDIGFLVSPISSIKSINIYIPFSISKDEIIDLGSIIGKNETLLTAIFNTRSHSEKEYSKGSKNSSGEKEIFKLKKITLGSESKKREFHLLCFDENDFDVEEIHLEKKKLGSIIKFKTDKNYLNEDIYIRLRLY